MPQGSETTKRRRLIVVHVLCLAEKLLPRIAELEGGGWRPSRVTGTHMGRSALFVGYSVHGVTHGWG